ncbi:MAG: methylated-DNA-[protein]-cysteine S-methyltransferase [Solirubrobacteraceae bacterium]|nr:methylated-DNA-[protein]-cysteine S-methyltransferase [Solirubrobacteraceae bacterium]
MTMSTIDQTTTTSPAAVWDVHESPLGPLTICADRRGVTGLSFPGRAGALDERAREPAALAAAVAQFEGYFAGERQAFDLPLHMGGTPFQRAVWRRLREIPYGTTVTYSDLARSVGRPDVVRAVAAAVGRTPVPIVIPCHRVVAADGGLTGYLGGLHRKQALLDLERRVAGGLTPEPAWGLRQLAML